MKLLSVAIPCYNSQDYMEHCVDTLLVGGEDIEIIIVNDGSKDRTLEIANSLKEKYPTIIKVIDKPNGGHGSAVNAGIVNATGKYYKVVDSDDWVGEEAFKKILATLKSFEEKNESVDLFISNFIYDKQGADHKKVMEYTKIFPQEKVFTWDDSGHFPIGVYILMHAIIYRTEILRESKLQLPEHTFYVDNIFAFNPFPYAKKIYYLNVDFYHYFIGRNDQSVNVDVMIKRIDQQLRVNYLMIDEFKKDEELLKSNRRCRKYMYSYLEIIMSISSIMCYLSNDKANFQKKKNLWKYLKKTDPKTYRKMRCRVMGMGFALPGAFGRAVCKRIYNIAQNRVGFN